MKILVTGANGYLGRGIVEQLINQGHQVIATDYSTDLVNDRAMKKPCDLFEMQENPYVFFGEPEVLLHLAWRDGFVHYSEAHIEDLPKHYKFIKAFAESSVKRIAIMGSMHEVGFFEGCIKEDTPCNPINPYGISKNALRMLTQIECQKNDKFFQWMRGFYIVSNSQYGSSIFSKIVRAEQEGKKEFPFTSGQNQYDFLDYDCFCMQVAKTVTQDKVLGVINICSGRPEKLSDRVERFLADNNMDIKLKYGAFPDRPYDSVAIWGDRRKIDEIMAIN